jgi:hypothetical protein
MVILVFPLGTVITGPRFAFEKSYSRFICFLVPAAFARRRLPCRDQTHDCSAPGVNNHKYPSQAIRPHLLPSAPPRRNKNHLLGSRARHSIGERDATTDLSGSRPAACDTTQLESMSGKAATISRVNPLISSSSAYENTFTIRFGKRSSDARIDRWSSGFKCRSAILSRSFKTSAWSTRFSLRSCADRSSASEARVIALPALATASASSLSENRCNSSACWAIRDENSYSPTIPATTSTAKKIFASLHHGRFSRNGRERIRPEFQSQVQEWIDQPTHWRT